MPGRARCINVSPAITRNLRPGAISPAKSKSRSWPASWIVVIYIKVSRGSTAIADGVFYPSGSFRVLPPLPEEGLREALRHRVLDVPCEEAGFDPELAQRMRQWQHSGFSVHNQIRV